MATFHDVEEMAIEWTADGTDHAATLAELQIVEAQLVEAVRGGDMLTITANRAASASALFARNQRARLRNSAGAIVFHGWAKEPVISVSTKGDRHSYSFESAARFLASVYKQLAFFTLGTVGERVGRLVPNVILNWSLENLPVEDGGNPDGSSVRASQIRVIPQSEMILSFARDHGNAGGAAPFAFDLAGLTDFDVPMNARSSISCAEALNLQLMWNPAIDWHFDCRGVDPVLRLTRYDFTSETPGVSGAPYATIRTLPNDGTVIAEMAPQPQGDRICSRVEIVYSVKETEDQTSFITYADEFATFANESPVTLSLQVECSDANFINGQFGNPEAKPGAGLAARIQNACARVLWQLNFTTPTTGLRWEWRLGDLWNVSGAAAAQAAAYSAAIRITRDLIRGTVRVETGAPSFLGMDDLLSIMQITRSKRATPSSEQKSDAGGWTMPDPVPPEPAVIDPDSGAYPTDYGTAAVATVTLTGTPEAPSYKFAFGVPNPPTFAAAAPTPLAYGESPTAALAPVSGGLRLDLGIPAGAPGTAGTTPAIYAVEVNMLAPGEPATGAFTGAIDALTLTLNIPRGATGADGSTGSPGEVSNADLVAAFTAFAAANGLIYP